MNCEYEDCEVDMYIQIEIINTKRNTKICFDDLKKFKIENDNIIWLKFTDEFSVVYKFESIEYEVKKEFSYYPHVIKIYTEEV